MTKSRFLKVISLSRMVTARLSGCRGIHSSSPTLNRVIPNLGYVLENVRVISWRANSLKGDGTLDEMEKVLCYMETELTSPPI